MENQNNTGMTQVVIENIFMFKDGGIAVGCNLLSGTVKEGDKLYYTDCTGREGFEVNVVGVAIPGKGNAASVSYGEEPSNRVMLKVSGCKIENLHMVVCKTRIEENIYGSFLKRERKRHGKK